MKLHGDDFQARKIPPDQIDALQQPLRRQREGVRADQIGPADSVAVPAVAAPDLPQEFLDLGKGQHPEGDALVHVAEGAAVVGAALRAGTRKVSASTGGLYIAPL